MHFQQLTAKKVNMRLEYIHLNPVKAGSVQRSKDWRWSSVNEYSGVSAAEQERRCGLTIDRVNVPSDPTTRTDRSRPLGIIKGKSRVAQTSEAEVRATRLQNPGLAPWAKFCRP